MMTGGKWHLNRKTWQCSFGDNKDNKVLLSHQVDSCPSSCRAGRGNKCGWIDGVVRLYSGTNDD